MLRRQYMTSEFGIPSFDKEFGAANTRFSRGLGDPVFASPRQELSKTNCQVWAMRM